MRKIKKALALSLAMAMGLSLVACGGNDDATTEATTEVTTEETTTEVTTTEVTTTEASNIITDNGSPMSYKEAVNAYKEESEQYLKNYWVQHEDRLYSMDSAHVIDENDNSYIKFADSDFSYVKMYPGDLLIEFGGGWDYDIYPAAIYCGCR